ncbi:unnamed protein product, partial [Laminaria digitata]
PGTRPADPSRCLCVWQISYTGVLSACSRAGKWQASLRLLVEMREAGVPPNAFSYSAASKTVVFIKYTDT